LKFHVRHEQNASRNRRMSSVLLIYGYETGRELERVFLYIVSNSKRKKGNNLNYLIRLKPKNIRLVNREKLNLPVYHEYLSILFYRFFFNLTEYINTGRKQGGRQSMSGSVCVSAEGS
jgi:hypothetical protein